VICVQPFVAYAIKGCTLQPLLNREESLIDARGERRWLLTSKTLLRETPDKIVGLVGIGRDITERELPPLK